MSETILITIGAVLVIEVIAYFVWVLISSISAGFHTYIEMSRH